MAETREGEDGLGLGRIVDVCVAVGGDVEALEVWSTARCKGQGVDTVDAVQREGAEHRHHRAPFPKRRGQLVLDALMGVAGSNDKLFEFSEHAEDVEKPSPLRFVSLSAEPEIEAAEGLERRKHRELVDGVVVGGAETEAPDLDVGAPLRECLKRAEDELVRGGRSRREAVAPGPARGLDLGKDAHVVLDGAQARKARQGKGGRSEPVGRRATQVEPGDAGAHLGRDGFMLEEDGSGELLGRDRLRVGACVSILLRHGDSRVSRRTWQRKAIATRRRHLLTSETALTP